MVHGVAESDVMETRTFTFTVYQGISVSYEKETYETAQSRQNGEIASIQKTDRVNASRSLK